MRRVYGAAVTGLVIRPLFAPTESDGGFGGAGLGFVSRRPETVETRANYRVTIVTPALAGSSRVARTTGSCFKRA